VAKVRVHLFIEGRVQGVWFRAFTRDLALGLDLKGWVRNLSDGRVEAVFEGRKEDVEKAISGCYKGPPGAYVTNIETEWEPFKDEFSRFEIKYY
jgi:acylphosphatase